MGKWSEAKSLSEAAARDDPYSCTARVCGALVDLAAVRPDSVRDVAVDVVRRLAAASHLDPTDLVAMHNLGNKKSRALDQILVICFIFSRLEKLSIRLNVHMYITRSPSFVIRF